MKNLYLITALCISVFTYAQEDAWVYFNSKPDADFYFNNPLEMLSQRAIDRRTAQGIDLDIQDIPIHQPYIDQVAAVGDIQVMAKSKWLNAVHVRGSFEFIATLANFEFVQTVDFADNSLDGSGRIAQPQTIVRNRTASQQVIFPYGNSANQIEMLNGHLLHAQDFTGSGKIIAVLDAGFPGVDTAAPFDRLHNNNQILGGYNFVDRDENFYTRNSHGTLVLSTMGGYQANQLVGTAPDADYYLFITEDNTSENPVEESYWVEAAEMADSLGVDVINTSLGYFEYDNPAYSYTYEMMDGNTAFISRGADIAFSRGMIVVVSAGNSGNSENPNIGAPGDAINVLTVGAVDANEQYVGFSSIGPTADGRVKPDVMAKGLDATVSNVGGNIVTANGTSFSGPIIAGMVATFWQAVPTLTNAEVIQYIKESADFYFFPTFDMGYGVPDFSLAYDNVMLGLDQNAANKFKIYPNPVLQNINIAFPQDVTSADISIYNTLGKLIVHRSLNSMETTMPLEQLQSGLYMYKIVSPAGNQSGRLIKQ